MLFENRELTLTQFLEDYWQKKPLLLRRAFPDFKPELSADDIAGLACEELAESRLITGHFPEHNWSLRYGPFTEEDFRNFPGSDWTLLVQDVEKHYPPLLRLMDEFRFISRWRIDDLMVSVAGPGGSVGPHVDQYDVFLLQAQGKRRWEIANSYECKLLPDCELNVLQDFSPEQTWVLEAGDMLYLPPGVAHHGVALEPCMTWSIGMRAPSAADLLQSMGDWLASGGKEGARYRDPGMRATKEWCEIDRMAIAQLRALARRSIDSEEDFMEFAGAFLSRYRLAHEPAPPGREYDSGSLRKALSQGSKLRHNPWTRLLWIETRTGARVFAAGTPHSCSIQTAKTVCDRAALERLNREPGDEDLELFCKLVNEGHLYLETVA